VTRLKDTYPHAVVQLWATDVHRLELNPIIRKVWSPKGERPTAKVHHRYEWIYLYSFVHPTTGVETALVEHCAVLSGQPEINRSHTHYHWWPEAA
jgi:hypothetical protein